MLQESHAARNPHLTRQPNLMRQQRLAKLPHFLWKPQNEKQPQSSSCEAASVVRLACFVRQPNLWGNLILWGCLMLWGSLSSQYLQFCLPLHGNHHTHRGSSLVVFWFWRHASGVSNYFHVWIILKIPANPSQEGFVINNSGFLTLLGYMLWSLMKQVQLFDLHVSSFNLIY